MSIRRALCVTVAAGLLSAAGAAAAQPGPDLVTSEELARRDKQMRERIDRLEKLVRNLREVIVQARLAGEPVQVRVATDPDPEVVTVKRKLEDIEAAMSSLNGRLDNIDRDLQMTRQTLSDDIATRRDQAEAIGRLSAKVEALEANARAMAEAQAQRAQAAAVAGETPEQVFDRARQLVVARDNAGAATAFQDFLERFPDAPQAAEARYWLGETLYAQEAYGDAATAYIGAIRGWPKTTWAPRATMKLGRSLIALDKPADACRTLGELGRRYPNAPAAVASAAADARKQAKCG